MVANLGFGFRVMVLGRLTGECTETMNRAGLGSARQRFGVRRLCAAFECLRRGRTPVRSNGQFSNKLAKCLGGSRSRRLLRTTMSTGMSARPPQSAAEPAHSKTFGPRGQFIESY